VKGTDWGIGAGLIWEPRPNDLWIGLSYQSRPNLTGEMVLEGGLTNILGGPPETNDVILTSTLPDVYRLGLKKRINGRDEFRLFGDFTRWSTFDQQCLIEKKVLGDADPFEFCATKDDGSAVIPANGSRVTVNLFRRWEDAWGVRTGYSHYLAGGTELFADLGYDANAIPDTALEPSLMDMDKVSAGLGATFALMPTLDISVSANNIFYADRSTKASDFNALKDPSKSPNPAGDFTQNVFFINVGLLYHTAPTVAAAVTAEDL
jgi:long-chain fatty acid transport protein